MLALTVMSHKGMEGLWACPLDPRKQLSHQFHTTCHDPGAQGREGEAEEACGPLPPGCSCPSGSHLARLLGMQVIDRATT